MISRDLPTVENVTRELRSLNRARSEPGVATFRIQSNKGVEWEVIAGVWLSEGLTVLAAPIGLPGRQKGFNAEKAAEALLQQIWSQLEESQHRLNQLQVLSLQMLKDAPPAEKFRRQRRAFPTQAKIALLASIPGLTLDLGIAED